jgi:hypothetical protein
MNLQPEQTQALDYLRRRGTEVPVERLREHVATLFRDIEALLASVPPGLRTLRPAPSRWSVQEIVDHLVESHRPAAEQLREMVSGRRPETGAIPAHLQSAAPLDRPWEDLVGDLHRVHRSLLDLLETAPDETSLGVTAPVLMVLKTQDGTSVEWVHELDWKAYVQACRGHTAQHRAQIVRTLDELDVGKWREMNHLRPSLPSGR